jgi:hypothetical protein
VKVTGPFCQPPGGPFSPCICPLDLACCQLAENTEHNPFFIYDLPANGVFVSHKE